MDTKFYKMQIFVAGDAQNIAFENLYTRLCELADKKINPLIEFQFGILSPLDMNGEVLDDDDSPG